MTLIEIYGASCDSNTFFCEYLAKKIVRQHEHIKTELYVFLEVDYLAKLMELRKTHTGTFNAYVKQHIVFIDGNFIGDYKTLIQVATDSYGIEDAEVSNSVVLNRMMREETFRLMDETQHDVVFLQFANKTQSKDAMDYEFGTVYIELYNQYCPKGCENFLKLCKGAAYSYKDCPIHRIVKDGWFQSGDVIDGSGANSVAVLDTTGIVPDESFSVDFSLATGGIVGYANSRPHSNGSQFFVTLGPCGWMNNKFVGIGRVLQGFSTLRSMNVVPVENQSPSLEIVVDACGVEIAKSK